MAEDRTQLAVLDTARQTVALDSGDALMQRAVTGERAGNEGPSSLEPLSSMSALAVGERRHGRRACGGPALARPNRRHQDHAAGRHASPGRAHAPGGVGHGLPRASRTRGARDLLEQNLRTFVRVCEIVEFAHAKGVMHRDIKPANVMLGSFGEVYLLDWGLALALNDEAAAHLPRAGVSRDLAGTLAYAAPEMVAAVDAPLGPHTDVYLLGAVLFELATGHPPHDQPTVPKTFESIAATPPVVPADVSPSLAAICARALAKEPSGRFAEAAALRRDVLDFLRLRDSEHVVLQAQRALDGPREACRDAGERREIYDLYGECRFAFREALHMWPENETARKGLEAAATLVIEHELLRDPRVAMALLEETPDVDARLTARVRDAGAKETKERERLAQLAHAHDQDTGLRARRIFYVALGVTWAASQFADPLGAVTHLRFAVSSLVELPLLLFAWVVARDMMKTPFNRRLMGAVAVMLVAQAGLFFTTYALGVDLRSTRIIQLGLWATIAALLTSSLERRLWPMTLGIARRSR